MEKSFAERWESKEKKVTRKKKKTQDKEWVALEINTFSGARQTQKRGRKERKIGFSLLAARGAQTPEKKRKATKKDWYTIQIWGKQQIKQREE